VIGHRRAALVLFVATLLCAVPLALARPHYRPVSGDGDSAGVSWSRQEEQRRRRPGPVELWRLYPLNPLTGRRTPEPPQPSPSPTDQAVAEGPVPDTEAESDGSGSASGEGGAGFPLIPGLMILGLAGVVAAWVVARRESHRESRPSPVWGGAPGLEPAVAPNDLPPSPRDETVAAAAPAPRTDGDRPRGSRPKARPARRGSARNGAAGEHVRVHLNDGRCIQGWKRDSRSTDQRVLILDVETVFDASGREVGSTPLDRFLLPPQIERIEPLD
jgi:hypothetical protein